METDFNNVQDQNLIDDSIVNDISAGDNAAGQVGSVVHPGDQATAPPPAPTPPKPPAPPQRVPTAQEILGEDADSTDDDPLPDMSATQDDDSTAADEQALPQAGTETTVDDIPQPELQTAETEPVADQNEEADDEPLVPAPAEIDNQEVEEAPQATEEPSDDEPEEEKQESEEAEDENDMKEDEKTADDSTDDAPFTAPVLGGGSGDDDELMGVKQEALEELSPLVDHLDLPADQKFDTYMEILRASDDKTLVKPAFEAAKAIEEEDKRAQALLDVVNEVNYLTQEQDTAELGNAEHSE